MMRRDVLADAKNAVLYWPLAVLVLVAMTVWCGAMFVGAAWRRLKAERRLAQG